MPKRLKDTERPIANLERRDGFPFRAGRLALDFAATVAGRKKRVPRDLLSVPSDLDRWLTAAALPVRGDGATTKDLASARALREALYRLVSAHISGQIFAPSDRATVNRWAACPCPAPQLSTAVAGAARWTRTDVGACLAAVALDAVTLLTGPDAECVRECNRDECALLFVDTSRSGERRWCSMRACGNKVKVSRFRERAKSDA